MEQSKQIDGLGDVYALLARASRRPRYAFLVLQLIAELADDRGQAGPYVECKGKAVLLRDWLCDQLLPISEQPVRRSALRERVKSSLAGSLTGNDESDAGRIEQAIDEQVRAVGRANVSRAVSELVKAGIVSRFYKGYATNHANQGGGRNVVYVLDREVIQMLPKARMKGNAARSISGPTIPSMHVTPRRKHRDSIQGDLFAA